MTIPIETLKELQKNESLDRVSLELANLELQVPHIVIPEGMKLESVERHLPTRVRTRHSVATNTLSDFTAMVADQGKAANGCIFIATRGMSALAILNYQDDGKPGHCDDRRSVELPATPSYRTLHQMDGKVFSQKELAELLEEYRDEFTCYDDQPGTGAEPRTLVGALAAIRNVKIKASATADSSVGSLREERSLLESVSAEGENLPPTWLTFTCQPYTDLKEYTFVLRCSLLTGEERPRFKLRVLRLELAEQEMRDEMEELIADGLDSWPIYVGDYGR